VGCAGLQHAGRGGRQPAGIGEAFTYGWTKFQQNVGPILLAALGYLVAAAIIGGLWFLIVGALVGTDDDGELSGGSAATALISAGLFALVAVLLAFLVQAGITRGAPRHHLRPEARRRDDVPHRRPRPGDPRLGHRGDRDRDRLRALLRPRAHRAVLHDVLRALHHRQAHAAIDAIKASFGFVNKNLGTLLGFYVAAIVATFVGALLCGIGLLVALPVIVIGQAFLYRRLQGEPVAP
jgi:hypothetical protein